VREIQVKRNTSGTFIECCSPKEFDLDVALQQQELWRWWGSQRGADAGEK